MPLSRVEGQARALDGLRRALAGGRLHHACLFAGPDGVGKGLAAQGLAEALLCLRPLADGDACGTCGACTRTAERNHPDLHLIARQPRADGAGLESSIKIEQVRELQKALSFKAFEGGRRVILLFEPETMNPATANALLKTLEEPGPATHFILVSHAPHRLLPTIVSRCQQVRFHPLARPLVARLLAARAELSADAADLLAGLAEGSVGKGLQLVESPLLEQRHALLERLDAPAPPAEVPARLDLAERLANNRADLPLLFLLLRTWLRDQILLLEGLPAHRLVHRDQAELLATRVVGRRFEDLANGLELVNQTERDIFEGNANPRLFLERLFLHLGALDPRPDPQVARARARSRFAAAELE